LRYAFIDEHQQIWPVLVQCAALEVSRSGFYDYLSRQSQAVIDAEETTLIARIQAIAAKTRSSYGSRCMTSALHEEGFQVGRYKVRRLMKDAGGGCNAETRANHKRLTVVMAMEWLRMCWIANST
jgi:putative transposase